MLAACLGGRHSRACALADETTFKLDDSAHDMKEKSAARRRRVDGFR